MFWRLRQIVDALRRPADGPAGRVSHRVESVASTSPGWPERFRKERLKKAERLAESGRVEDAIRSYRDIGVSEPVEAVRGLCAAARAAQRTKRVSTEWTDEILPPPMAVEDRMAAIAYYRAAVELRPPGAGGTLLGLARLLPADSEERVRLLEIALNNDPKAYRIAVELGDACFVRGDVQKAAETYERAVQIRVEAAIAYRRLVWLYERGGDDAAVRRWRRMESERPTSRQRTRDRARAGGVQTPVWCVVANVRDEQRFGPGGEVERRGTKHFPPGAKVYCDRPWWGDGYEKIIVVGLHRGRGRRKWVRMVVSARALCNARAKMVYEPAVLRRLDERWDDSGRSQKVAEGLAGVINSRG